ncbi:MAG: hypothetical protein JNK05_00675 [Myxococcales bacterium]|nr:hypothetical protein [Myxococcales bacterium]
MKFARTAGFAPKVVACVAAALVVAASHESEAQTRRRSPRPPRRTDAGVTVRARPEQLAATRMSFRGAETANVPGTGGDATRVVASQPGVARTPYGVGFFAVRGTSFENTGLIVEGFPVPVLYHFAAGPSVVPTRLVSSLDFYPGGYPAQFGRYAGGLVSLEIAAPDVDRRTIDAEVSIFGAGAAISTPLPNRRGGVSFGVRRSYYDLLLPIVFPSVTLNFGDAQAVIDWRISDRTRAQVVFLGSTDVYDRSDQRRAAGASTLNRDGIQVHFFRVIGKLEHRYTGGFALNFSAMVGADDIRFASADTGRPDTNIRYGGATVGERLSVRIPLGTQWGASVGLDSLATLFRSSVTFPELLGTSVIPNPQANRYATYAEADVDQWDVTPWAEIAGRAGPVDMSVGARASYLHSGGKNYWLFDPRAVVRVALDRRTTLVASTGLFSQPAPFFALVPLLGNGALGPQTSWQSSAGIEARLDEGYDVRSTFFINRSWGLPRPTNELVELRPGDVRRVLLTDNGEGFASGVELYVRRRLMRGVFGWVSATWSRAERWIPGGAPFPFVLDQSFVLNAAASWEINSRWRIGARFSLSTGTPTNRVSGATWDADASGFRPDYMPEGERLPVFHQLDLRVDYRFRSLGADMNFYVDVLNTYFARGTEGWNFQYDYRTRQPLQGLPLLPIIGLKAQWR